MVGVIHGWGWSAGIVFGLAISVASTVVLMRVLADSGDLHTRTGHIAVGWLVVEDLFTVLVLVLLPAVFGRERRRGGGSAAGRVLWPSSRSRRWWRSTFFGGRRLIPWLLARVAATRSRELFTLTVLVLALGIAVGSAKLFGVSMALGAFLAGHGRRPVGIQPAGGHRSACRCATPSPCCSSSRSACSSIRVT